MKPVNINEVKEFEPVKLFGKLCLLSYKRIDEASIPEGLFKYDLRHGDDWGVPCEIDNMVICNYFGTIITNRKFPVDLEKNFVTLKCDDDNFDLDYDTEEMDDVPYMIDEYIGMNDQGDYDIPVDRCKEYAIPHIVGSDKYIDKRFKLTFEFYEVNISNEIPEGYIYVSDANYDEEVIVTRLPLSGKLLTLKNVSAPPNYQPMSQKHALINFKTAMELMVDLDGLGDVICIVRPNPFHNWGLSKTGEPVIIN